MVRTPRARRGLAVAAVVVAGWSLPCSGALAADDPSPSASASPSPSSSPGAEPSVPSDSDVDAARDAAEAATAEIAELTDRLDAAEARLEALQVHVAEAVSAQDEAEQELAAAETASRAAITRLAVARRVLDDADSALSGHAALMYMQGGELANLTTMLLTPPDAISDVSFVLDQDAHEARERLDAATAAEAEATARTQALSEARLESARALHKADRARAAATREAEKAGAEAARLSAQQEEMTARLRTLRKDADDLEARRALAARDGAALLGLQVAGAASGAPKEAQDIAQRLVTDRGWDDEEFACLVTLWHNESGWSWSATNPSSGAYGIPQSLPGWKMASAGEDWLTNPETQIRWGLGYIEDTYGSPCGALDAFSSRSPHWY
ncbi:aggregation-promoting factor C-terminal-like domain-containing protein [Phycicoccus flavus]|uniref:Lytic transglycosylase domain-containing protein n=1 Tax=Phycicoccus flavus TaxID=2502783 RepID=A0A8T6R911_9MICO|nr:hypothetical protein [Phycicoccus flavus]NHA69345.1 hypothetical protein [Phycicoccus flavus]